METKSIRIGDLEIPTDYWSLSKKDRREICLTIIDAILTLLDQLVNPEYCRKSLINTIIDSSIQTNVKDENYEVCQVLSDIKLIINE